MQTLSVNKRIKGTLSLYHILPDGTWQFIQKTTNDIMYSGSDLMAKAIVGTPGMAIRGMYMEYDNVSPITAPAIDRTRTPAYYEALTGSRGYMRVPLTAGPGFTASDTEYTGNIVTVQAQTNGTFENGPGIIDGTTQVFSAGLVVMPDPADKSQDILFSAANIYDSGGATLAPVPKIANAQIGIKWDIKFL